MEKTTAAQLRIMYEKYLAGEMSESKWIRICEIVALQMIGEEIEL